MKLLLNRLLTEERGQDLTEYTLLIVFILLAMIGLANGIHNSIAGVANTTDSNLQAGSSVAAGS